MIWIFKLEGIGNWIVLFCWQGTEPLIALCFEDSWIHATVSVFLIIACGYNLAKEVFQMFDEVSTIFPLFNVPPELTNFRSHRGGCLLEEGGS